jgi:hypothetical protein
VLPFVNDEGMPCPVRAEPIPRTNDVAHQRSLFKARLAFSWAVLIKAFSVAFCGRMCKCRWIPCLKELPSTAAAVAFRKKGKKRKDEW